MKPIRQGTFKGVKWRSLTSVTEMRSLFIERKLRLYKRHGIDLSLSEALSKSIYGNCHGFHNMPVEAIEVSRYYRIKSKYNNNFKIN